MVLAKTTRDVVVTHISHKLKCEKVKKKFFNKFYQSDESHFAEGNGIGLAIVKKVTELYGGRVYVENKDNLTAFTVVLPKVQ